MEIETREKIKDAFIEIYADLSIEKITIKMITQLAGINRATFYAYYQNVFDLLEQIENEMYERLEAELKEVIFEILKTAKVPEDLPENFFYRENKKYLKVLLATEGKSELGAKIKEGVKNLHERYLSPIS